MLAKAPTTSQFSCTITKALFLEGPHGDSAVQPSAYAGRYVAKNIVAAGLAVALEAALAKGEEEATAVTIGAS